MLRPSAILILLVLIAGSGCGPSQTPTEASGVAETSAPETARPDVDASRIVTLGGPITEIVYALGLGDRVVGTDGSSLYPAEILDKPRLDYFRQTSAEGVLSLDPTLVLAVEGTGPPGVLEQIEASGVTVVVLPEVADVVAAEARVREVGRLLGRDEASGEIVAQMEREIAGVPTVEDRPKALFIYARGAGVLMVSGTGNAADAMMTLAGADNAVTAFEDFQPLTAEAVVTAAPDVIIIPERGLESIGGIDGLLQQPGLAQTPAGKARRVVAVDDALLLGFGPRVGEGVASLAQALGSDG